MPKTIGRVKQTTWGNGLVMWTEGRHAYISVVFSWLVGQAQQMACWYEFEGYTVHLGGPAIDSLLDVREYFPPTVLAGERIDALSRHNPDAVFTSRGCIRQCQFCIVPKIEGDLRELSDNEWEPSPIICDNNFLACSQKHIDRAIDRLKAVKKVDFNQGLDARLLTPYYADRLAELDLYAARLAWDHIQDEDTFLNAFQMLTQAGIRKNQIRVYVLIGFNDTPTDALYRLQTVQRLGAFPNPMRYQPIDTRRKNSYVGVEWTGPELVRFMRYWSNLRHLGAIPFDEFGKEEQAEAIGQTETLF